jgi:hypothetical protein
MHDDEPDSGDVLLPTPDNDDDDDDDDRNHDEGTSLSSSTDDGYGRIHDTNCNEPRPLIWLLLSNATNDGPLSLS